MSGRRRQSREIALQVLYQLDVSDTSPDEALRLYCEQFEASVDARPFAEKLIQGVYYNRDEIDGLITSASENWRLERMSIVDRNVLRIAVFEMLFCNDVPPKVSINEAIDLGKTFGTEESGGFINGILDHLLAKLREQDKVASDKDSSV